MTSLTATPASPKRIRLLMWVAIVAAAAALLVVASVDQGGFETDGERIQRLSSSFACPECRGQSVSDSNAAVAINIRDFISAEVAAGSSDEAIRDQLVAAYDASVLLNPPASGISALVWVLPVVMVMLGAVALAAAVTRNSGAERAVTDADSELVKLARERAPGAGG